MGSRAIIELLVAHGADVNLHNGFRWTPLHTALFSEHIDVAELLVAAGSELDIFSAAGLGMTERVADILKAKPDLARAKDGYHSTPLHWAARNGHQQVVELLLVDGAEVNVVSRYGSTPLHLAAEYGREAVTRLLLAKGAQLDLKGRYGSTPLHWAARNGHTTVVELLMAHKADVNAVNGRGLTPLRVALKYGRTETAERLRRFGARE